MFQILSLFYSDIVFSESRPRQVVIKFDNCTFLLFGTGVFRFMGKADYFTVSNLLDDIIKNLDTYVITPLSVSTQTIAFKLNVHELNLHVIAQTVPNISFEAELFPAISLNFWYPLHVNVFSSGKVVVLGKDALQKKCEIEEWIMKNFV